MGYYKQLGVSKWMRDLKSLSGTSTLWVSEVDKELMLGPDT